MIHSYNDFNEDLIIESVLNESIIYFSPNFKRKLSKIEDNITNKLLDIEGRDLGDIDVTFIDSDDGGNVTFTTMKNAAKWLRHEFAGELMRTPNVQQADFLYDNDSGVYRKSRNTIKIGKLIRKIIGHDITDVEIENFTNKFKATVYTPDEKIEIVSGEDIRKWYNFDKIYRAVGSLGNSCMNIDDSIMSKYFDIYCENPTCKMIIMTIDGQLIARALLWELSSVHGIEVKDSWKHFQQTAQYHKKRRKNIRDIKYFMDRTYYIHEKDNLKLNEFAKSNKFARRSSNRGEDYSWIWHNGEIYDVSMSVSVKPKRYTHYPYLDTFKRFDWRGGKLWNDFEDGPGIILNDTRGSYRLGKSYSIFRRFFN